MSGRVSGCGWSAGVYPRGILMLGLRPVSDGDIDFLSSDLAASSLCVS